MYKRLMIFLLLGLFCTSLARAAGDNWYMRYQLITPIKAGVYANIYSVCHAVRGIWDADYGDLPASGVDYPYKWVKPGGYSPWVKIPLANISISPDEPTTIALRFASDPPIKEIEVEIQLAAAKDEKAIFASKIVRMGGSMATVLVSTQAQEDGKIISLAERIDEHLARAQRLFPGPIPEIKGLQFETGLYGFKRVYDDPELLKKEKLTLRILGINGVYDAHPDIDQELGFQFTRYGIYTPNVKVFWDPRYDEVIAESVRNAYKYTSSDPYLKEHTTIYHLGDEPDFPFLRHPETAQDRTFTNDSEQAAFRKYLQEKGLTPQYFGKTAWEQIEPIEIWSSDNKVKIANVVKNYPGDQLIYGQRLYYHSRKFESYAFWLGWKKATDEALRVFGPDVKTAINVNPHLWLNTGMDDVGTMQLDWGEGARMRASTMPFTEDWLGETGHGFCFTHEFLLYLGDEFRGEGKYPGADHLGMYVTANNVRCLLQKCYALLGRGVKHISYYSYGPQYSSYDEFSEDEEMLKGMGIFARQIEKIAPDLPDMKLTPAQVGVLWPFSAEVWRRNMTCNTDIMMTWLMADRNQASVDLVYEADIDEMGILPKYKVLYGTGDHLTRKSAAAILAWVKKGGVLMASPGFALKDEYDNPLDLLKLFTGSSEAQLTKTPLLDGGWSELANKPEPLDIATTVDGNIAIPVYGWKQTLGKGRGKVLAAYKDGSPAAVVYSVGRGMIFANGFFPSAAYAAGSNRWSNADSPGLSTLFPEGIARFMRQPFTASKLQLPVQIKDVDGIQVSVLSTAAKKAVILVNYRRDAKKGAFDALTVFVPDVPRFKKIWTTSGAPVQARKKGTGVELTLPLDAAEMVVIE